MSKERLEEIEAIEQEVANGFAIEDLDLNTMTVVNREHFEWLIEQAEQMRELEREYCKCVDSHTHVEMQNKRYRDYLEEIADVKNGFDPLAIKARMAIEEVEALESDSDE